MFNLEHAIRERAYHLWLADGCRDAAADAYWIAAQREMLSASMSGSDIGTPSIPSEAATVQKKRPPKRRSSRCRRRASGAPPDHDDDRAPTSPDARALCIKPLICGQPIRDADTVTKLTGLDPAGGAYALGLQIAILKVLASYPDGRATVAAMKNDLAILGGAGVAWSQRLKALAARAPSLDIFSEGFVIRDSDGWQLTPAGRKALHRIEHPAPAKAATPKLEAIARLTPAGHRGHAWFCK